MKSSSLVFPPIAPAATPTLADEINDLTRQIDRLTWKRDFIFRVLAERPSAEPVSLLLISPGQEATLKVLSAQAIKLAAEAGGQLSVQWGSNADAPYPLWLTMQIIEPEQAPHSHRFCFMTAERLLDFMWHWCFESTMGIRYLANAPALYAQWETLRSQLPVVKPDSTD